MFQYMDSQFFMTFKRDQVMPVSLVIAHKEIFAMRRRDILPIFESDFNSRKWRMPIYFEIYIIGIQKVQNLFYGSFSLCRCGIFHLLSSQTFSVMRRHLFLEILLFVNNYSRLAPADAIDEHSDSQKYEWDTKQLSHVQYHILFETDLRLLDEFYQES